MKQHPTSLITGEIQTSSTVKYRFTPTRKAIKKKKKDTQKTTSVGKNVEEPEPLYFAGGNVHVQLLWKIIQFLKT